MLWGRSIDVNPAENYAHAERLVHIEACPRTGGTGRCPLAPGTYSFYGRFRSVAGDDRREPLPTTFISSYMNGGAFSAGTTLAVWRDSKQPAGPATTARPCGTWPSWVPLPEADVVAMDEQESAANLCTGPSDTGAPRVTPSCFPLQTQEVDLRGGNTFGDDPMPPFPFGWVYLNLNEPVPGTAPFSGVSQAWVQVISSASGRYSVGYNAVSIDSACGTPPAGGVVLIP